MERYMTGITDVDREILMRFNDKELFAVCSANKYSLKLCDERFFKNRSFQKFGEILKPDNISWKKFYLIASFLKHDIIFSDENIKLYFAEKDYPTFIKYDSKLDKFLISLKLGEDTFMLYNAIFPLYKHDIVNMEVLLKIIIICKFLNIKDIPENFLNDLLSRDDLTGGHLPFLNSPSVKNMDENIKRNINSIYKEKLGKFFM